MFELFLNPEAWMALATLVALEISSFGNSAWHRQYNIHLNTRRPIARESTK
jgi:hypothetical protein